MIPDEQRARRLREQHLDPEDPTIKLRVHATRERLEDLPEFNLEDFLNEQAQFPSRLKHYLVEGALHWHSLIAYDRQREQRVAIRFLTDFEVLPAHHRTAPADKGLPLPIETGLWNDQPYLALPHYDGPTLRTALKNPLDEHAAVNLTLECARQIQNLHDFGTSHSDLNEHTVILSPNGPLLAIPSRHLPQERPDLHSNEPVPNISHLPPSLLRGEAPTQLDDIYQLGYILCYALTLKPIINNYRAVLNSFKKLVENGPPRLHSLKPNVSEELDRITHKAMAFNPEDRYQSARDLADELHRFLTETPTRIPPVQPETPAPPSLWARIRNHFGGQL